MIKGIITQYNDRDSLYGSKLTNHLNMGLFALCKMGATEDRIHEFAGNYIVQTNLPFLSEPQLEINRLNFLENLGIDGLYSAFIPYFEKEIDERGQDAVLREYLNLLIKGEAGGAFHGLIRVAYAVELNDRSEIAKALAYFAEAYHFFSYCEPESSKIETDDPLETALRLSQSDHFKSFEFKRGLIIGRMMDIHEDPHFPALIGLLDKEQLNSQSFSELLLNLYLMTDDFTVLHGFTSTHALRVLEPYLNDYSEALSRHWLLIQLAYLSTKCTAVKSVEKAEIREDWGAIHKKACSSNDVHTVKLVYSLWQQSQFVEDDSLYRLAAWKKAGS